MEVADCGRQGIQILLGWGVATAQTWLLPANSCFCLCMRAARSVCGVVEGETAAEVTGMPESSWRYSLALLVRAEPLRRGETL